MVPEGRLFCKANDRTYVLSGTLRYRHQDLCTEKFSHSRRAGLTAHGRLSPEPSKKIARRRRGDIGGGQVAGEELQSPASQRPGITPAGFVQRQPVAAASAGA
jgi:hypothetical protein